MRNIKTVLGVLGLLTLMACGDDRTYEYEEKTQHNRWMLDVMRDKYLWADTLQNFEPAWKDYFATPSDFMSSIVKRGKNDSWSYVVVDSVSTDVHERGYFNHIDSYGMDFALVTDPTGMSTRSVARVLTVYPDSPAEAAGLRRNDFIYSFDGYKLSTKNVARLKKGVARTLEVRRVAKDPVEGAIYWSTADTVQLGASRYVEDVAFPVHSVIGVDGKKVGYIMCSRLLSGLGGTESVGSGEFRGTDVDNGKYLSALDKIMANMKKSRVDEIVLDLRLCNYGDLGMVQRLASYLRSDATAAGTEMLKVEWNTANAANNSRIPYDASVSSLGVKSVAVITGAYTRGAAEWLIQALFQDRGKENVVVVGTATAGQNVMTAMVDHDYHLYVCPAVAYVGSAEGGFDYGKIVPDVQINEQEYLELNAYSSMDEILLKAAVTLMHGGTWE